MVVSFLVPTGSMTRDSDIAAIYADERARLERQIGRRVGCRAVAADLVQDIFLRIWERATVWTGETGAYLNRCGRNAAIDHIRAEKSRATLVTLILPEQYAAPQAGAEQVVASRQELRRVQVALAELPDKTRHVFLLNRVHGRSFSQIARAMAISERMVAKHMLRAVTACHDAVLA